MGAGLDLSAVLATPIDGATVGFPAGASTTVGEVAAQGWTRVDLPLPSLTLRASAISHDVARMAAYCATEDVDLAPHGKTSMAPQLWARQLDAGAWGITAATVGQALAMRRVGVPRVLLASEPVDDVAIAGLRRSLEDPPPAIACWVDSVAGVARMDAGLRGAPRPLDVMVEVGHPGGRTGARGTDAAIDVARAVAATPTLRLIGVAGYEGTIAHDREPASLAAVDGFLGGLRAVTERVLDEGLFAVGPSVSAGGSLYFDRVVAGLRDGWPPEAGVRVLLRAGCTVTHDHGLYARGSPFADAPPELRFRPAFEARGAVLSRPEPTVAVIGLGARDVPDDIEPPIALATDAGMDLGARCTVRRLMDQHAICEVPADLPLAVGDVVRLGISHPCRAFDRRRVIPVLDDDDRVVDAIVTWF